MEFKIRQEQVDNTVALIDDGKTIPFIARYRKELTGSLDDQILRELYDRLTYLRNLEKRKDEVFGQEYDSFVNSLAKNLNEPLWESVALIHDDQVTTSSFFDIYKENREKRKK